MTTDNVASLDTWLMYIYISISIYISIFLYLYLSIYLSIYIHLYLSIYILYICYYRPKTIFDDVNKMKNSILTQLCWPVGLSYKSFKFVLEVEAEKIKHPELLVWQVWPSLKKSYLHLWGHFTLKLFLRTSRATCDVLKEFI